MFKNSKRRARREVKLIDYGLCADFTDHSQNTLLKDKSGTACYMAPEIIGLNFFQKFYDQKADVFSVGIILFEIFAGKNPFQTMDYQQSLFKNFNCLLDYSSLKAEEKVVSLIRKMTQKNQQIRCSAPQALGYVEDLLAELNKKHTQRQPCKYIDSSSANKTCLTERMTRNFVKKETSLNKENQTNQLNQSVVRRTFFIKKESTPKKSDDPYMFHNNRRHTEYQIYSKKSTAFN